MSKKEWHVEPDLNPFSLGAPEFVWRLRDEKGWFELWTKQEDAWRKACGLVRRHGGRAVLHRKDGSVRSTMGREAKSKASEQAPNPK
ncbi:MAG: hypothetical protein WAU90_08535 [Methyloceanibacter sp.]